MQVFRRRFHIGLILGEPSGGLVDVDLDCPEARELAEQYLPPTPAVTGRPSAPHDVLDGEPAQVPGPMLVACAAALAEAIIKRHNRPTGPYTASTYVNHWGSWASREAVSARFATGRLSRRLVPRFERLWSAGSGRCEAEQPSLSLLDLCTLPSALM